MNPAIVKVLDRGSVPTRTDIAEILASIGEPGEKQDEKQAAIQELFELSGHNPKGLNGHVLDTLSGYEAY